MPFGMTVNLETAIAPLFNTIQMPSNPFQIPLQMGDVNWYPGAENVAPENTALSTARQTLTAHELVAEVPWSYDLDEDAVIAMMEELRRGPVAQRPGGDRRRNPEWRHVNGRQHQRRRRHDFLRRCRQGSLVGGVRRPVAPPVGRQLQAGHRPRGRSFRRYVQ